MRSFATLASIVALSGAAVLGAAAPARADITVGFVTSLSGPGSSIGIPYARGIAAAQAYSSEIGGEKIKVIQLDDNSDPSTATRDARKLVEEDKVDVLIGTATAPSTTAMAAVANELKVPFIAVSPISGDVKSPDDQWAIAVPQPAALLVKIVADRMKRDGIKNVGFIGFSDGWGDLVYAGGKAAEARGDIHLTSNERYARTDTSVTAQILKVIATHPDGVLNGGSGTQGALPLLALQQMGYKGANYGTVALINPDFVRVGGTAANGIQVSAGPVLAADDLPDGHFAKQLSFAFRAAYLKANNIPTTDGFSAYSFDAWLILHDAATRAMKTAKPGTPEFRKALDDAMLTTHELAGVHAVYNFTRGQFHGVDDRSLVVMRLVDGKWKYAP